MDNKVIIFDTTLRDGEQAPGAVCCAYKGAALSAANASIREAILRITQIYTSQFGRGPRVPREYTD